MATSSIPWGLFFLCKGVTMKKSWYEFKAQIENEVEIIIYDEIGFFGITAKDFIEEFQKIDKTAAINLRINSTGGDVFDGLAIHNILKRHQGKINVTIDGIAASIASVIAMAGDNIAMPENTFMMIHDPIGFVFGDSEDMRELAETLDKIKSGLVSSYVAKSGLDADKVAELMADETWLTAKEAKDLGFSDETIEAVRIAARADLHRFKHPPDALKATSWIRKLSDILPGQWLDPKGEIRDKSSAPNGSNRVYMSDETLKELKARAIEKEKAESLLIMDLCAKAGIPDAALDFITRSMTPDQVHDHVADAHAIRDACTAAGVPNRVSAYIKAGMKIEEVRTALIDILKARDIEIDNKIGLEEIIPNAKPVIDVTEIYSFRRKATVSL